MTMTYTNVLGRSVLGDPAGHSTMCFEALARASREARKACELDSAASERHVDAALEALQTYKAIVADERMWQAERDRATYHAAERKPDAVCVGCRWCEFDRVLMEEAPRQRCDYIAAEYDQGVNPNAHP